MFTQLVYTYTFSTVYCEVRTALQSARHERGLISGKRRQPVISEWIFEINLNLSFECVICIGKYIYKINNRVSEVVRLSAVRPTCICVYNMRIYVL